MLLKVFSRLFLFLKFNDSLLNSFVDMYLPDVLFAAFIFHSMLQFIYFTLLDFSLSGSITVGMGTVGIVTGIDAEGCIEAETCFYQFSVFRMFKEDTLMELWLSFFTENWP